LHLAILKSSAGTSLHPCPASVQHEELQVDKVAVLLLVFEGLVPAVSSLGSMLGSM